MIMKLHSTYVNQRFSNRTNRARTNRHLIDLDMYLGLVAAFVIIAITYATAYRSCAIINPAVTVALLVTGKIRAKEAALYIACQILGAVLGAAVVYSMFGLD